MVSLKARQSLGVLLCLELVMTPQSLADSSLLQEKLRIRSFNEFMSPAFYGKSPTIPASNGDPQAPTLMVGYFSLDYELSANYRLLYFQRNSMEFAEFQGAPAYQLKLKDPRFGLRKLEVVSVPGLFTQFDFYFQPGITDQSKQMGRILDLGVRTVTSYSIPESRLSVGAITDLSMGFFQGSQGGSDLTGVVAPWVGYELSSHFGTQHLLVMTFKNTRGKSLGNLEWDFPGMPILQNGISYTMNSHVSLSLFLNNYLLAPPSLKNTWASLWVSLAIMTLK
jgi:hypothetical protein